jgi:DNA-binding CsgD family transcriptional regulator
LLLKLENDTTNFDSKPLKYQMFEQISIAYDQLKDVSAAFSYYKLFVSSKNEVINEENNRQIRNQEINFTINKVEQEKEIERLKNVELKNALDEIREKNNELLSSLTYAKRLQEAILPPPRIVKEWLTESFLFYRPKDIVSGDFYWMETVDTILDGVKKTLIFFAAADCTGHGVPGAMVSVVCANALNRSVKEFQLKTPGGVLNKVTELVLEAFEQSDEVIKDGMDIALCALDISANKLFYSGANNPLYRITKTAANSENKYISADGSYELLQYNACRSPIGKQESKHVFVTQEIQLNSGDAIYMFSDGFPDQFGGQKGKKYKYANFKRFLLEHYALPMEQQKSHLEDEFDNWKQSFEQIDDVCIIGVKINDQEKDNLTPRELEILTLIAQGLPSKIIADKLYISKHTVDTHRRRLLAKTGTVNSSDLVNYARKKDII